ncbi:MAG: IclR family transcriptional regulator [Rhodospirillaceae bacterium]|nr:IclR family transcriptional regulator [Rhodospirillaceae bacterium]
MGDEKRIPPNLRILTILEALSRLDRPITAADLLHEIDLPKPTLYRLCATLEAEGYLISDIGGRLRPARRAREIAVGLLSFSRLHIARRQILSAVAEALGETCNIAIPDDDGMVYLDRVDAPWPLRIQLPIGSKVPFHCTAGGKLFLSSFADQALDRLLSSLDLTVEGPNCFSDRDALKQEILAVREAEYSWDNEEFIGGMVAYAVPIRDRLGRFVASLAFHAPVQRVSFAAGREHIAVLRQGADKIERILFEED